MRCNSVILFSIDICNFVTCMKHVRYILLNSQKNLLIYCKMDCCTSHLQKRNTLQICDYVKLISYYIEVIAKCICERQWCDGMNSSDVGFTVKYINFHIHNVQRDYMEQRGCCSHVNALVFSLSVFNFFRKISVIHLRATIFIRWIDWHYCCLFNSMLMAWLWQRSRLVFYSLNVSSSDDMLLSVLHIFQLVFVVSHCIESFGGREKKMLNMFHIYVFMSIPSGVSNEKQ